VRDKGRLIVACAAGAAGGSWIFFSAFQRLRLRRAILNTPTSKARSAAMGKCELKGLAKAGAKPLTGPFSGKPCVWYGWKVEEESRDSKGNTHWREIARGESFEAFFVEDATGSLKIEPRGAEVEALLESQYRSGGLFFRAPAPGPQAAGWLGGAGRRLTERRIPEGSPLYALGVLRGLSGADGDALPVLTSGRDGEPFFLAARSEDELGKELFWSVAGRMLGGACLCVGSVAVAATLIFGW
jgi:hypothetical protein